MLLSACFASGFMDAQSGCTDSQASNYNAAATINDGSCSYPVTSQTASFRAYLPSGISESSGLKWIDGHLYTFNDSGGTPYLFEVDSSNGSVTGAIHVTNFGNTDWEEVTSDSNYIYIGDFGNNNGDRTDLKILKISKSQLAAQSSFTKTVTAQAISFSYADQSNFSSNSNTNFDCETMVNIGDTIYLFTKNHGDLKTRAYMLPKSPGTYTLSPYTTYNVNGMISGADYNPVNKEIELIGYLNNHYNSFIWHLDDYHGNYFFSGNKRRIEIGNAQVKWQTEGITFFDGTSRQRVFISCETTTDRNASIYVLGSSNVFATGISATGNDQVTVRYLPDGSLSVSCTSVIIKTELYDLLGQEITARARNIDAFSFEIGGSNFPAFCLLKIYTADGKAYVEKLIH